ncbi:HTH_Tnp_Tc3_2 domain-containing protein [Trichonephila clavipes]|uniref:HTH_Tnp_Tc3_2 domain-containing protein n=1 Tax=Trichonephila clavipes TaxID=2585209 RepID=A0A8X6SW74_TRICX|nr:HTH_Tnp_Tc3_2 domain-containing protein [Trichonephila clavipes]
MINYHGQKYCEHDFAALKATNHDVAGDETENNSTNPQTLVVENQHINPPKEPELMENAHYDALKKLEYPSGSIRETWNHPDVISRLWQWFQDDGNISRRYSTGRHRVTTPNEVRYLAVTAKRNIQSTASDLSRQISSATGTKVSRQTVYRRLGLIALYARRPVKCTPLSHCLLRLARSREDNATVDLCDVFRRVQIYLAV